MALKHKRPHTILAVEDDPIIRRAIEKALHGMANVRFAPTGKAAVEALQEPTQPAFVLLDYMLPDMDGLQVLTHVRKQPATHALPVVIFSSLSDPQRMRTALASGANSWVTKTDDPKAFEVAVQAICNYWLNVHAHH